MLSEYLRRVHEFCFHAIGGEENEDVRYVLHDRPLEVTRADFFKESTWAIHASGVSRKVNAAFCDRATACGFPWDFGEVADWGQPGWNVFFGRLYPGGVSGRGGMKWAAVRHIAGILAASRDDGAFRAAFFGGKSRSADLNRDDVRRLRARRLPFIGPANSQYVVRNMGGEAVKCDRWVIAFIDYLGVSGSMLEDELVGLGISLSLFDVVLRAYCERHVRRVTELPGHFDGLFS